MMKIKVKRRTDAKRAGRLKKKIRIRKKVNGSPERPRLCVFRSLNHIYAQVIDDTTATTLVAATSLDGGEKLSGMDQAKLVGKKVAEAAQAKQIKNVVFDRNGFIYHGRVKALADSARESGLNF